MRIVGCVVVFLCLSIAPAAAQVGETPSWLLTTDWGLSGTPYYDEFFQNNALDVGGAGGVELTVRKRIGAKVVYADLELLPVGGAYGGRVGIVLGKLSTPHFFIPISQTTSGNTTTTVTEVHPERIRTVMGLEAGVSAHVVPDAITDNTASLALEAGFGVIGQWGTCLQGAYDVVNGTPGIRVATMFSVGGRGGTFAFRLAMEAFFDFKEHPLPLLFTIGMGGGDGYDYRY